VFWYELSVTVKNIHDTEHPTKQKPRNTSKSAKIIRSEALFDFSQFHVCLDVLVKSISFSFVRTRQGHLRQNSGKLPYCIDSVRARFIEQDTTCTVEHALKETSEKSGETAMTSETDEVVVINVTPSKGFIEVLAEVR
jgi:hypothetical protein